MLRSVLTSKFERLYNDNKIKQLKITGSQQTLYNIIYFLLAFEKKKTFAKVKTLSLCLA